jgi:protein SCO1/2
VKGALIGLAAALAVFLSDGASAQRWGAGHFPNVTLTTQHGEAVRFYDDLIKGKIVAINLIYTTCKFACPLETARLKQIHKLLGERMGRDVFFYSITIDPDHDTPAVLKEYARQYDAGAGWVFLTGKRDDIDLISARLGLNPPVNPTNPDGHTPTLLIGNEASGQWMRSSALSSPSFLARTIGDWLDSWRSRATAPEVGAASGDVAPTIAAAPEYLFSKRCAACHTIGGGDQLGPDLAGVTTLRDPSWLRRFITAPDRMNEAGDPIALALRSKFKGVRMPNLGLREADAAALIDYIDKQSRLAGAASRTANPAAAASDVARVPDRAPGGAAPAGSMVIAASVLTPYLRVQQALYHDRLDEVKEAAEAISAAAPDLPKHVPAVVAVAGSLQRAATTDLAAARLAFAALNELLVGDGKTVHIDRADVHVAYCPMARKYWLQAGRAIQNPFYGQRMADCGRIVLPTDH